MTLETRTYRMTVLSPVHIGCDHVYDPTSFVIREEEKNLVSFNPFSFLEALDRERLDTFSSLCQQGTVESLLDIYKFIYHHAQGMDGVKVGVSDDFIHHYLSVLKKPRHLVQKELNSFLLNRTSFNPVTGNVYIPGSAFKGSLRTAILNSRHSSNPQSGLFTHRGGNGELQKKILDGGQFATDPFSRVKVSDFRAVSDIDRKIMYGVARKKKPGKYEASALYQVFEVIEPGAVFEGSITIETPDKKNTDIRNPVTFSELEGALTTFYEKECKREAAEVAGLGADHGVKVSDGSLVMRIGRHSGAECVTIDGKRQIKIMAGRGQQPKTLDRATTIWFTSENRKPRTNSGLRPFGWVSLLPASTEQIKEGRIFAHRERKNLEVRRRATLKRQEEAALQRAEFLEQQRLVAEKKARAEAEALAFPWRPWLKSLKEVNDWGLFRQHVLDNEKAMTWRAEPEVSSVVLETADRVRNFRPDKWSAERDRLTSEWLEPAGVVWKTTVDENTQENIESHSPLGAKIEGYRDWGQFKHDPVELTDLDEITSAVLLEKLKGWGCNGKKVKKDKKRVWQKLQAHIRGFK